MGEGRRQRGSVVLLRAEHTYPVRLNQKTEEEEKDGWRAGMTGWKKKRG